MTEIDLPLATEILARIGEPPLLPLDDPGDAERPDGGRLRAEHADVGTRLDRALADALQRLQYTVNRPTFEFLRWKVLIARETAERTLDASSEGRARRASAVGAIRWFRSALLEPWSVTEMTIRRSSDTPRSCLVFASQSAVRRVWTYPENWRELTDLELERLSWER